MCDVTRHCSLQNGRQNQRVVRHTHSLSLSLAYTAHRHTSALDENLCGNVRRYRRAHCHTALTKPASHPEHSRRNQAHSCALPETVPKFHAMYNVETAQCGDCTHRAAPSHPLHSLLEPTRFEQSSAQKPSFELNARSRLGHPQSARHSFPSMLLYIFSPAHSRSLPVSL